MGFWNEVKKGLGFVADPGGIVSDVWHAATGSPTADERRNQQNMINEQIKAYKDQTELAKQDLANKKNEIDAQKRRIEEKQIRALRRNYRPQGFLGSSGGSSQDDMNTKLGG